MQLITKNSELIFILFTQILSHCGPMQKLNTNGKRSVPISENILLSTYSYIRIMYISKNWAFRKAFSRAFKNAAFERLRWLSFFIFSHETLHLTDHLKHIHTCTPTHTTFKHFLHPTWSKTFSFTYSPPKT